MKLCECPDATGWTIIPDYAVLRAEAIAALGPARGNQSVDAMPINGWICIYDDRKLMNNQGGIICQADKSQTRADAPLSGEYVSVCLENHQIRSVQPPIAHKNTVVRNSQNNSRSINDVLKDSQ
jgi:hypothetical protein